MKSKKEDTLSCYLIVARLICMIYSISNTNIYSTIAIISISCALVSIILYRVFPLFCPYHYSICPFRNLTYKNDFQFVRPFFQFGVFFRNLTYDRFKYNPDGLFFHFFHVFLLSFIHNSIN